MPDDEKSKVGGLPVDAARPGYDDVPFDLESDLTPEQCAERLRTMYAGRLFSALNEVEIRDADTSVSAFRLVANRHVEALGVLQRWNGTGTRVRGAIRSRGEQMMGAVFSPLLGAGFFLVWALWDMAAPATATRLLPPPVLWALPLACLLLIPLNLSSIRHSRTALLARLRKQLEVTA